MAIINDPAKTGTRYFFQGREKRNVTGWATYMDRAERKAYRDRDYVFYDRSHTDENGNRVTRFYFGKRGAEKVHFEIHRTPEAYRDYLEGIGFLKVVG